MSGARDDVLGRIRRAIGSPAAAREQDYATIPRQYRQAGALDREARLELFRSRLEALRAAAASAATGAAVAGTIGRALTARGRRRLIVAAGLPVEWLPAAFECVRDEGLSYGDLDQLRRRDHRLHGCDRADRIDRACATTRTKAGAR